MRQRRNVADAHPCAQEGCEGNAEIAGFCKTDYSGWRTILPLSPSEILHRQYMRRRLAARYDAAAAMRIPHRGHVTVGSVFGEGQVRHTVAARRSSRARRGDRRSR